MSSAAENSAVDLKNKNKKPGMLNILKIVGKSEWVVYKRIFDWVSTTRNFGICSSPHQMTSYRALEVIPHNNPSLSSSASSECIVLLDDNSLHKKTRTMGKYQRITI